MNKLRYVILRHEGIDDPHFDLMLETKPGSELLSARLSEWPITKLTLVGRAPEHGRAYLEYEGPVSKGRGTVTRVKAGTCRFEMDQDDVMWVRLDDGTEVRLPQEEENRPKCA
jgi:hypothetical protein